MKRKLMGICLAVCVTGAAMTACSAGRQTDAGGVSSVGGSASQDADKTAEAPADDGENSKTTSGGTDGAENGSAGSAGQVDGQKGSSDSGGTGNNEAAGIVDSATETAENAAGPDTDQARQGHHIRWPETEDVFPLELLTDSYLNGPDICPAVTFEPDGPVTAESGRFLLSAVGDGDDWCYDEFEVLKRYMHGEWYRVPILTGFCGNTSYYDIPSDKAEVIDTEWQWLYGELPPGIYCLEKDVYPRKVVDADYEDMEERVAAMEEVRKHVCAPFVIHGEPDIQMEVWDVTPTGLKLQFTRMPGNTEDVEEYDFGSWYELEQYTEGEWRSLSLQVKGKYAWEDMAYIISDEGSKVLEIDWEWLYGTLEDGRYRICKNIYPERDASQDLSVYTAFEIEPCREDAE